MTKQANSLSWRVILLAVVIIACLTWYYWPLKKVESMQLDDGMLIKFRPNSDRMEIFEKQEWKPFFVKGVNLGATIPGHDPGEMPINKETYLRWFSMIQEMGANTVRVYTILSPDFYKALAEFNQKHNKQPLYLIQGVWSPEEQFEEDQDALTPKVREAFKAEIEAAVIAVYGNGEIPKKNGKAGGTYSANAGPYLLAWHIGTEWDPLLVKSTNERHEGEAAYDGTYFRSRPNAVGFENFLAEMLDTVAVLESKQGWQHPQTFTNWVTTDPLKHPGEPMVHEDLVSVDPTHIESIGGEAGYFASYHVYPYYPDFFRLDPSLQNVQNNKGKTDTYLAYLRKLKEYHKGMPVMITEYGVPSSFGLAHLGNLGRNQGGHDEIAQGNIDADLYNEIVAEKFAGAILFSWQDEWFKKTWNTMHYEYPEERRKYWLNVLTNEKMFGVLGFDPNKGDVLHIDGDLEDWKSLNSSDKMKIDVNIPGWKDMWVSHDEAYVYVALELTEDFNPEKRVLYLGVDTVKGGNRHAKELGNRKLDEGLETLITIGKEEETQMTIASNYDFNTRLYGQMYGMFPVKEEELKDDSGLFKPWKLAVDLEQKPPDSKKYYPFEDVVVGHLPKGTSNPEDTDYNSRALWQAKGKVVEMRIPWMLMGFTDPSSLQVMSYNNDQDRKFVSVTSQGIRFVPWIAERNSNTLNGLGSGDSPPYAVTQLPIYQWSGWNEVHFKERKKQSYSILKSVWRGKDQ